MRAAAVSALANFGASVESLRPRVTTLLQRALSDNDDEVSVDRAEDQGEVRRGGGRCRHAATARVVRQTPMR